MHDYEQFEGTIGIALSGSYSKTYKIGRAHV